MRLPLQTRLEVASTLARRGLLRPVRPDRALRQALSFWRWGASLAAAYSVHGAGTPDQPAIADEQGRLTYGEVDLRTNALAHSLRDLGVREADSVAVLCRNGRAFIEPLVACSKLGADVLFLNTSFSSQELGAIVEREQPSAIVYDQEFQPLVDGAEIGKGLLRALGHVDSAGDAGLPSLESMIAGGNTSSPAPPEHESRPVVLTSGTTGTPKGARVARPAGIDPLAWILKRVPLHARSPYLIAAPMFHAHGFGQLAVGSALGCELIMERRFDAERTLSLIQQHRPQGLAAVPVMLKRMLELPAQTRGRYDTSSLRVVLCSGSALPGELARSFMDEFGPVLYNLYGSTEISGATIATPEDLIDAPGTVGRAMPHATIAIVDDHGHPVPQGRTGHIFVGHEMLFEGYTDGSTLTDSGGLMSAGDLGHVDEQGRLFIDSRADDMIISGGENVYPGEVEAILHEHPDIEDVAVVGAEDERFGERLVAFVVPRAGSDLTADAVQGFAKETMARFKVPKQVFIRDELPRNALGKVLKRELRRELQAADR
jgi:acyl-CoA synthetase (AMP-forming)/AMP-acid ligase II